MDDFKEHKLKFSLSGLQRPEASRAGPTEQTCLTTQRREAERVDLMTAADGDGVEDLTEEMKEKLRKGFMPSDSDEGEPAPDYVTNGVEWTTGKAEVEPEVGPAKPSVQTKQSSEESSEDEDDWTRRNRRQRRHRPACRELRWSKAEDESTWTRRAWELTKQALKNVLCV